MEEALVGGVTLGFEDSGPKDAPALVLVHALGTNMGLWDPILPLLPGGLRVLRFDLRGHGVSAAPPGPYAMGALVGDTEKLMVRQGIRDAVVLGMSLGGMIAQGLAIKRLDLVRGLILSNTAAKIGQPKDWKARIDAVRAQGMSAVADTLMERWFTRGFAASEAVTPWRDMVLATKPEGYAGCCAAISGTDYYTPTSGLRLPALGIAGSEDGSTPPDLVRETVGLIPGSRFELMRRAGHLPHVERPEDYAALVAGFLRDIGHV